jgi:FecR-like protein
VVAVSDEEREGKPEDAGATSERTEAELAAFMRELDWGTWKADAPPADFAQRVVERALPRARKRARHARWFALSTTIAAAAAIIALWLSMPRAATSGQRAVSAREEIALGRRAVAVLEAGAELRWQDERVAQSKGDVFYRVNPGGAFVVVTPAGTVSVLGTCFSVSVEGETARVSVLEGRVRASAASEARELAAGQSASLGARGVRLDSEAATPSPAPLRTGDDRAQAELSASVSRLRDQLGVLEREKTSLERDLRTAQSRLAELRGEPPERHRYDLSREDWQELARAGGIKYRIPCAGEGYRPSAEQLDELGLAPDDAEPIVRAYAASRARVWQALRPLCVDAIGSESVADLLGRSGCVNAILQAAARRDSAASDEAMRQASEIRAGLRAEPAAGEQRHPVLAMFLTLTAEPALFEAEIAQSLGPEDARRVTFNDVLCREQITLLGPGPRKE